jgi:hypothetical protein
VVEDILEVCEVVVCCSGQERLLLDRSNPF